MSSFSRISKGLLKYRFKIMTFLLGLHIVIILASKIYDQVAGTTDTRSFTGGVSAVMVVGLVFLTIMIDKVYSNDKYRLIPVSDTTLYLSNNLTALVSYIYLTVGEIIIYITASKVFPNAYDNFMIGDYFNKLHLLFSIEVLVAFILGVILLWVGVTLLHLVINWINGILPFKNQSIGKVILTIVVIGVLSVPFNFISGNVLRIMGINNVDTSFKALMNVMASSIIMMIIWIVIFTGINLYLLNKWSESNK